jgi:hypothetical protein
MPMVAARQATQRAEYIGGSIATLRLDDSVLAASSGRSSNREQLSIQGKMSLSADGGRTNRLDLRALAR